MIFHRIFIVFLVVVVHADYRDPIYPIENPCLAILTRLAQVSADFLNCAVTRSRPFRLCEGCVTSYGQLDDLVKLLSKTYSDLDRKITCQQFLESYDSIQLVAQMISFVNNIWITSFCNSCIASFHDVNGTIYSNLTTDTVDFFNKKVKFDLCLYNATGQIVPIVPIDLNVTANTSVCSACVTTYNDLNHLFFKMTQENQGVCMDLVDTMNYTRLLWSKIYACRRHDPDYMAVIGISVFIPTLVLVFYVSAVFKGERKEKKLSRRELTKNFFGFFFSFEKNFFSSLEKRLPRRLAANARVDTQTWLWSNLNE
uniref:Osteopetrosis associated transmembrane protein n=1 Tax=Philodina roseola TaxID=96448 RepID=B5AHC6_PHIRO|nr:osteopetrosis associated transmembrane protein [Philodina roseola]